MALLLFEHVATAVSCKVQLCRFKLSKLKYDFWLKKVRWKGDAQLDQCSRRKTSMVNFPWEHDRLHSRLFLFFPYVELPFFFK
jgi:hypothetical protein